MRHLVILLAMLVFALPAAAEGIRVPRAAAGVDDDKPRLFILAIGIGSYRDEFWPELKWPESDAKKVADRFGRGTGAERVVTTLIGKEATLDAVRAELDTIAKRAKARDAVIVYLSTHGSLAPVHGDELEPVVVLSATTSEGITGTGLLHSELRRRLGGIPAAKKLLMLATCNSGVGKSKLTPRVTELLAGAKGSSTSSPLSEASEGTLILAAAARSETARENDALQGDVYTHYVIEGLDAGDRNQDGAVSALEAHDYAKERVYAFTKGRQRPTVEAEMIGDADVRLRGKPESRGLPVLDAYGQDLAGFELRIDGGEKGKLPLGFPLKEGKSKVEIFRAGDAEPLAAYRAKAAMGDRIALEDLVAPPPFGIAIGIATTTMEDARAAKLAGSPTSAIFTASLRPRRWLNLSFGVEDRQAHEEELRPNLDATFDEGGTTVGAEHLWQPLSGLTLGAGVYAATRSATLSLKEGVHGKKLEKDATTRGFGARASLSYARGWGFEVQLAASVERSPALDFGAYGKLAAARSQAMLGLGYRFGGVGVKLP